MIKYVIKEEVIAVCIMGRHQVTKPDTLGWNDRSMQRNETNYKLLLVGQVALLKLTQGKKM